MAEFVLTEALKKMIGKEEPLLIYKVEEGAIQRYAQAVGDSNPMHSDVEYAAQSPFGRLKSPPGFVGWPVTSGFDMFQFVEKLIAAGAPRGNLDGGMEYEFLSPIGAGDILAARIRIASIVGKETKLGPTMSTTVEITYTNQRGAVALKARHTFLSF
ncbi:MAG: MaoC family dehydratase N-terminal domain-containing protein [Dehalococcoidia bacterium]|nr:MaoC family dehydratase N-terminal domain-containing protein [Dehalococcoidia bacterium]MDD5647683.1 MaoC family dehydratase N-terminal domain-containing protein [Dehalococcoidia bacterium]